MPFSKQNFKRAKAATFKSKYFDLEIFKTFPAQNECGVVRVLKPAKGADDDNYYGKVPWMVALEEDGFGNI